MSAMRWIRETAPGSTFLEKSEDGYYAIAKLDGAVSVHRFESFHIEALWAKPTPIGWGSDVTGAKEVCEQHKAGTSRTN